MQKKLSKGKTSSPDQPDSALPSESQEISEHSENKGMGLDLPAEETGTTETEDQTPLP